MKRLFNSLLLLGFAGAATSLAGCSSEQPPLGRVTGYVRAEGQPVAGALVVFEPEKRRASVGKTNEEGWYELNYTTVRKGAELGQHTVRIEGLTGEDAPPGSPRIPSKYNSKSTLTADVSSGSNELNFDIEVIKKKAGEKEPVSQLGKE